MNAQSAMKATGTAPLPASIDFSAFSASDLGYTGGQVWSSSGPIAVASVLQYWGWKGDLNRLVEALKPNPQDENVMPYELVNYVEDGLGFSALFRMGGDIPTLKRLAQQGFPVIIERGATLPENQGWIGRYQVFLGYDDQKRALVVQVNFPEEGASLISDYSFERDWRSFNFAFLVIYPPEKKALLMKTLGQYAGEDDSARIAAQKASNDIFATDGVDRFFAWFNRGTSLSELDDFGGAAKAYDEAFALYEQFPENQRPWRVLWYQTRPYWAYFYTARYQDLIDLATATLKLSDGSVLEESYYWRALAREALGDKAGAIADLQQAVKLNPHFQVGWDQLYRLTNGT